MVVGILAVLVAVGYPALNDLRQRREVTAKVSTLNSAIRLARVEAVRRGRTVTLCPVSNPNDNLPTCGNASADWALGWAIFVDDGATQGAIDAGETIIQVQQAFGGAGTITNNAIAGMNFQATGLPMPPVQSTFTIASKTGAAVKSKLNKYLVLSAQGRVTLSDTAP